MKNRIKGMNEKADRKLYTIRPAADYIFKTLGRDLVGAEIGVFKGENAEAMLEKMHLNKLYLVDRYVFDDSYKLSYTNDMEAIKNEAYKRVKKFEDKVEWVREDSLNAAAFLPDELDFVYIDGNHTYEYVKADIENFWPKIKRGGVLCGHDYNDLNKKPGVKKAVDEFCKNEILKLHRGRTDWWIIKG